MFSAKKGLAKSPQAAPRLPSSSSSSSSISAAPAPAPKVLAKEGKVAKPQPEKTIETGLLLANVQVGDVVGNTAPSDEVPWREDDKQKRCGRKPGVSVRASWLYYGVAGDGGVDADRLHRFIKQMLFERREKQLEFGSLVSGFGSWGGPENAPIKLFGYRLMDACDTACEIAIKNPPPTIGKFTVSTTPNVSTNYTPPITTSVIGTSTPTTPVIHTNGPQPTEISPVRGILQTPVLPLKEACAPLRGVIAGVDSMVDQALSRAKAAGKASVQHTAAVYLYTMAGAFYQLLNAALRNPNRDLLKPYYAYIRLLAEAMMILPSKGAKVLWRGVALDLQAAHPVGSNITWWGVSSCTPNLGVARGFLGSQGPRTLFSVHADTAVPIQELSAFKGEEEYILAPGTRLEVTSVEREPGGLVRVVMKELPPPRNVD